MTSSRLAAWRSRVVLCLCVVAVLMISADAHAQPRESVAGYVGFIHDLRAATEGWIGTLQEYARSLFLKLAAIQLVWMLLKSVSRGQRDLRSRWWR